MKNLLIIYPHWHPVNLAGVHRARLVGNHLKDFGWQGHVLTVLEEFFEEKPDPDFVKTFSDDVIVTRVKSYNITKPRLIGDIGFRAYPFLYKKARKIIAEKNIDFIWIPIPSFYTALLGRQLFRKTGIPYGIDYIDPWVRDISNRNDWRHKLSNQLAKLLEPIAVKKASLITGVSYDYYKPVLERNFKESRKSEVGSRELDVRKLGSEFRGSQYTIHHSAFPYGFDPNDHKIKLDSINYPWTGKENVKPWIYAGAFLPNSRLFIKAMFEAISTLRKEGKLDDKIRLYFIGTGAYPGKTIIDYAVETGISDLVFEDQQRYPFLHILNFLTSANTVLVVGSTEMHYTASKVFQSLLSERPVWAIFHKESSVVQIMKECKADKYLVRYDNGMDLESLRDAIKSSLLLRMREEVWSPNLKALDKYSARESARKLVEGIEQVLSLS